MNLKLLEALEHPLLLEVGFGENFIVDREFHILYPDHQHKNLFLVNPHLYPQRQNIEAVFEAKQTESWLGLESSSALGSMHHNLKVTPLFDDMQDRVEGLLIQIEDQTDLKRSLIEMQARVEDMERTTTAKSQFLANMSHELRSPMTSVIGMSHLLLETELDAEQRECAEVIHSSSTGLLNLINDTLDFSKLDAGKVHLESISFNMHGLLSEVCKGFKVQCEKAGIYLILDYHPDCHEQFKGDPGKLRQVFNNFTSNAVKFTKEGGVKIEVSAVRANEQEETLKIVVHDSGIGMSEEVLGRIFQKFVQADDSTTRKYGGTGLGLAISKQLVELMGGEVGVDSIEGEGSSFWMEISFPIDTENSQKLKRAEVESKKILVVDGNSSILSIQKRNLISSGLECETSINAQDAIKKLIHAADTQQPFDAVISDFELPGMDGAQLGKLIKKDPKIADSHLIMLTSMGRKGDSKLMLEAGYDAYLVKPTPHETILEIISCCLAKTGPTHELITKYTLVEEKSLPGEGKSIPQQIQIADPNAIVNQPVAASDQETQMAILIAEDDPMIQKMMKKLMKKFKKDYCLVDNGLDALEKAKSGDYPVILMDWHMPQMDGLTATQKIREFEGDLRKTWIIGLTAGGADDVKAKCLQAGMDDHLPKPFEVDVLKQTLEHGLTMAQQLNAAT